MSHIRGAGLILVTAGLTCASARPITRDSACGAPFDRYDAPSDENWAQFPVKASPDSLYRKGTIQVPLTPQQSANCIEVAPGLKLELWASEENPGDLDSGLAYIQHFAFDERGRLWAVEPRSYPNDVRPADSTPSVTDGKFQGGKDRILILEDTDGDKVMDKVKVFKEGLNLPQSIAIVNGGVVVAMSPYIVFFPNVDDVAGTPVILFSGMGPTGNFATNGGIGNLMYGLDNWIYGISGYNSCTANPGGIACDHGRVWRFRHTALGHSETRFEIWTTGPSNAWGLGQMEDGQIFQSGVDRRHINHSIRQGAAAIDIVSGTPASTTNNLIYPITGDRRLWEGSTGKNAEGWFTSVTTSISGLQFYTSRLLPGKYWNRFAFACDFANKLCNQDSLVVSGDSGLIGSTWRAVRMPGPERSNLFASKDAWVAPIFAKTGPDGAVWVLDWYNFLNLHNPASPAGPGGAWMNHLRAKSRIRIWRVTPADGATEPILDLASATVPQLVGAFGNPNLHWRLQAQRLLIGKGWSAELGALLGNILRTDRSVDAVGNNPRVIHALWTLDGLGRPAADTAAWNPVLDSLLRHPSAGVRRNVLRVMPRTAASARLIGANCSVNDPHGHVRLQALVALSEIGKTVVKRAGVPAMWNSYRNVDAYAQAAFEEAGIDSSAALPCSPELAPATRAWAGPAAQPRSDLRILPMPAGFRLLPHGRLPSGRLTVWDARGRAAFRSDYDAGNGRWSRPEAHGLLSQVYAYAFRGTDGSLIQGRIALAGRP